MYHEMYRTLASISGLWWPQTTCRHIEKEGRKFMNHPCSTTTEDDGKREGERTSRERGSWKLHLSTMIVLLDVIRPLAHSWPRADKCALTRHAQIYASTGTRDVYTNKATLTWPRGHPVASSCETGTTSARARECCEISQLLLRPALTEALIAVDISGHRI